jgi:hypothetical protein
MGPQERVGFCSQNRIPFELLLQLEQLADQLGVELQGGSVQEFLGAGGEGGAGLEEGEEEGEGAGGKNPTLRDVVAMTVDKVMTYGATFAFYGAIPAILLIAGARRGMGVRDVLSSLIRLPFSD